MASLLVAFIAAMATIVFPASPAQAAPCTLQEWNANPGGCVERLADVADARRQCLKAPTPDAPDAGLAGWFASQPESAKHDGVRGHYSQYGYAGYSFTTYDIGCSQTVLHPEYKFENTVANGEFMLATAIVGASNALRERAWDPSVMWGWADPLVDRATKSVYARVFTVFGVITLAIVGLYLLWRSRQADMSATMTTAGWAILIMVAVTALASWPIMSARLADNALVSSLDVVHGAVGPQAKDIPPDQCRQRDPNACKDNRPPAVRASDIAAETTLYRNWTRGTLGSADSVTAQKYGRALYNSRSFSWDDIENIRRDPSTREVLIKQKNEQWMKIAEQIKGEDPEAYEYLQGTRGMERIGAGFIALLSAFLFALFDLTASLLVLLGFLLFRWAVIAAPILGTVALLRPASAGFRRLVNAVVAALFNIVIFGTGAAIYLFAVDLIMSTTTLPGWLQVVLVFLCGVVGWLLLRPYRRITQLGGRDSATAAATAGGWRRRSAAREVAQEVAAETIADKIGDRRRPQRQEGRASASDRPELRTDDVPTVGGSGMGGGSAIGSGSGIGGGPDVGKRSRVGERSEERAPATPEVPATPQAPRAPQPPGRRMPTPAGGGWSEPGPVEPPPVYTLYRPGQGAVTVAADDRAAASQPRTRAESRRDA